MAITKVTRTLLSTGIVDNSNATAITIDSSENLIMTAGGTIRAGGANDLILDAGESGTPDIYLQSGGSTKVKIEGSNGNVGIGTTSPSSKLQIMGGTSGVDQISLSSNLSDNTTKDAGIIMTMYTNNTAALIGGLAVNGNTSLVYGSSGTDHRGVTKHIWYTNTNYNSTSGNTERMRINSSGQVFIGTTTEVDSNCTALHTKATASTKWVQAMSGVDRGMVTYTTATSGTVYFDYYIYNGSVVGNISSTGSSTAYNTSSDYRLKENVNYTWDATTRLKQLKPARFNFKSDETNTLVDGFLAHEVSSIVPEAISGEKDAVDSEGNPEYQGIDQSKLVPLLVKTIQELEARITTLEG